MGVAESLIQAIKAREDAFTPSGGGKHSKTCFNQKSKNTQRHLSDIYKHLRMSLQKCI